MTWLSQSWGLIGDLTLAHVWMTVQVTVFTVIIAVPLARLSIMNRWARGGGVAAASALYAVPSLALFMIIPVVVGIPLRSPANVVIVLTLYGVAVMWRSCVDALTTLPGHIVDASRAVGFTGWQIFWRVELPLAAPVLLAALRVVLASTMSLITVGAVLGVSSLGLLFTDGFQRGIVAEVVTGIVVVLGVAWVLDRAVVALGGWLMPWHAAERWHAGGHSR